jgi:hypothetical protein
LARAERFWQQAKVKAVSTYEKTGELAKTGVEKGRKLSKTGAGVRTIEKLLVPWDHIS